MLSIYIKINLVKKKIIILNITKNYETDINEIDFLNRYLFVFFVFKYVRELMKNENNQKIEKLT